MPRIHFYTRIHFCVFIMDCHDFLRKSRNDGENLQSAFINILLQGTQNTRVDMESKLHNA